MWPGWSWVRCQPKAVAREVGQHCVRPGVENASRLTSAEHSCTGSCQHGGMRRLPDRKAHRLLPYERRLVAWQSRRWRASSKFDWTETESELGSEAVRLWAAYSAGFLLAEVTGVLGIVVGIVAGKIFGLSGFLVGFGLFLGAATMLFVVAGVRSRQSVGARDEHQRNKPLAHP